MSCRIDPISRRAILPNGKDSKLLADLRNASATASEAEAIYESVYSPEFKKFYKFDFEQKNIDQIQTFFNNLDENNEPRLFPGNGKYEFINIDAKSFPVRLSNKQKSKVLDFNRSPQENAELQDALLNTIVGFINNVKIAGGLQNKKEVDTFFNTDKKTKRKGGLAEKILQASFITNVPVDKALEYYKTLTDSGYDAFTKELDKDGVKLTDKFDVFITAYADWTPTKNSLGNITNIGVRDILRDKLSDYNLRLKDSASTIEEIEDEYVKIYNQSRLEENPQDKLSGQAKALLSNIEVGTNLLGYPKLLILNDVYSVVSEHAVGQKDFEGIISNLDYVSLYKPEVKAIKDRLQRLKAKDKAVIFAAFKNTYNNFKLFKQEKQSDGSFINKIIDSNRSQSTIKQFQKYKDNSVEALIENDRAVYKEIDGKLTVKPEKLKRIQRAWDIVKATSERKDKSVWSDVEIDALGTYLWELGMNIGPTLESTQSNLKSYYVNGNEAGVVGGYLFNSEFVFTPNFRFSKFIDILKEDKGVNFYAAESSTVKKVAAVSALFETKPYGSFISAENKELWPINLPTPLAELAELIHDPKQIDDLNLLFSKYQEDPLFTPGPKLKYQSYLLRALQNPKVREKFEVSNLDAYKDKEGNAYDYGNQTEKISLILRMVAHINGTSKSTLIPLHVQADRKAQSYVEIPKLNSLSEFGITLSKKDIIEGFIIQDLTRIDQAKRMLAVALESGDTSDLIEGYHYRTKGLFYNEDGSVFTMTQIYTKDSRQINPVIYKNQQASELVENFITGKDFTEQKIFEKWLDSRVAAVEETLEGFEKEMAETLEKLDIKLITDVSKTLNSVVTKQKFIKDFIFEQFSGRIEINKLTRSGYSFAKNPADFYKRMGLINVPGTKLAIQGFDASAPDFGMPPTYNALVVKDFDFTNKDQAAAVVRTMISNGVDTNIAELYRSVNKSDAQSFISVEMYKGIIQGGLRSWTVEDEAAYVEYQKEGDFNRPVVPLKPYHEEISLKNNTMVLHMDKNSYTVVTPQFAKGFPYFETMLDAMKNGNIHVVHTESATKGAKMNVQDFQGTQSLDVSNPMIMDSSKLRFPQLIPTTPKKKITFNRQIRKNIVTNVEREGTYTVNGVAMPGAAMQLMFGNAVAENVKEDIKIVRSDLGLSLLNREAKKGTNTPAYAEAKLTQLKKLRARIEEEVVDKQLPQNYLEGLDIVPNGLFDYKFKIPLSFPHYSSKYENIVTGIYNKEIFKQKLPGVEMVQIAELGGHVTSGELRMYDGSNKGAEVRIKASALGFTPEELEGKTINDFKGDSRLVFIGYRIPQQGKSSAVMMEAIDFLPETHEKAIMVPGALTVQMGSDFDIDKLNLIFRETSEKRLKEGTREQRNNVIFDVFQAILTDKKHLNEVLTPVSSEALTSLASEVNGLIGVDNSVNYNNPLAELKMESRNKVGIAGRGLYSNGIAGRNVAEVLGSLNVSTEYAPMIENQVYTTIAKKDTKGNYTDANISQYLSAAVDAAKEPIQIDINDNKYTIPVTLYMLSLGIPIETIVYFLAQPAITEVITKAQNEDINENRFQTAIRAIAKRKLDPIVTNMNLVDLKESLINETQENRLEVLSNFDKFYTAGKQLQKVYKLITPDNLDNVNEISSINAWIDEENQFLYGSNSEYEVINGAENYIIHQQGTKQPLNPIGVAYRGIFDVIVNDTAELGFIQNTPAFTHAISTLKVDLGIRTLNAQQYKFITRALYSKLMAQPHSPFMKPRGEKAGLVSEIVIKHLFNPSSEVNIVKQLTELPLKYPELNNNLFFSSLKPSTSNYEAKLALIVLDVNKSLSATDKNVLSKGLLDLIKSNNAEISNFGKLLVANQIITNGFSPTYGSYIDLIPSEVLSTDLLNPGEVSPVEFFEEELLRLNSRHYSGFDNFTHEFIRNYGTARPGQRNLIPLVQFKESRVLGSEITFTDMDPKVFINDSYTNYFKTKDDTMYVWAGENTYKKLAPLGFKNKIYEIGFEHQAESKFERNKIFDMTTQSPFLWYENSNSFAPVDSIENTNISEDPTKIC